MYRDDGNLEALIADLLRRLRVLETQAPVGFTAVSRGALRILSTEGLIVVGTARTTGTQYVDGRLEGSGVFDWTGPMWLRGSIMLPGNLTGVGTLLWSGPWELRGDGDITGDVSVTGDIKVLPGGKIQVGDMVIDPTDGGSVTFPGGAVVRGQAGNGVEVAAGPYSAVVRSGWARLGTSAMNFEIDGFTGLSIHGVASESGLGTPENTLHCMPDGRLRKSTGM